MFLKLLKKDYFIHRLVRLTMPHRKCGKIYRMIANLIFGHWDVFFTKWSHWSHPLEPRIWMDYLKESQKVSIHQLVLNIQKNYQLLFKRCFKWTPNTVLIANQFSNLKLCKKNAKLTIFKLRMKEISQKLKIDLNLMTSFYKLLECRTI
jgi:hypothetical protein